MGFFVTRPTNLLRKTSGNLNHKTQEIELNKQSREEESPTLLLHDDELATTQHDESVPNGVPDFGDVWYRRFLKPLTHQNRPVPYHVSFKRHTLRPKGIPVQEVEGLHSIFRPEMRHYSPLMGVTFTYNNFIDNLYRYGDPADPATDLVRRLFHALPGGEIDATHLGREAGSHLSPTIVGSIFEALENSKLTPWASPESQIQALGEEFMQLIGSHPDYQNSRKSSIEELETARSNLDALRRKDEESQPIRDEIKELEGLVIKKARHRIKHASKALEKEHDPDRVVELTRTITEAEHQSAEAKGEVDKLREHIVSSLELKEARKAVRRAQEMVDLEKVSLEQFVFTLARSLVTYDTETYRGHQLLPKFSTTAILLGWMWSRYDSIEYLEGYFESMKRINALNDEITCVSASFNATKRILNDLTSFHLPHRGHAWSPNDLESAASLVIMKPGVAHRPPVVPFSYISWADYSEFPDCGENALRNLFNQVVFNPETGKFDHALLRELKQTQYPGMKQKLIDFYEKHPNPVDSLSHEVSKDWIEVMSNLNSGVKDGAIVRYRREKQEQNIASPLKNVLRALNALLGASSLDQMILPELVHEINNLRKWSLSIDITGIKDDGFGIVGLSDGKVRYELQSYKPVHFGFSQVETMSLDSSGRRDLAVFQRLRKFISSRPRSNERSPAYFEQLALASLFVPYDVERQRTSKFFRKKPISALFAELSSPSQQRILERLAEQLPDDKDLEALIDRVRNYVEPKFLPEKSGE